MHIYIIYVCASPIYPHFISVKLGNINEKDLLLTLQASSMGQKQGSLQRQKAGESPATERKLINNFFVVEKLPLKIS